MASVVVGSIQVCFTAVAALIIDKTGRKVLLYVSGKLTYWLLFPEKKHVEYQKVLELLGELSVTIYLFQVLCFVSGLQLM